VAHESSKGNAMTATRDYSLNGAQTKLAFERGLVTAEWYKAPVPRERMKALMKRSNFPALWHVLLWFALIAASGVVAYLVWPTWWAVPAFFVYSTFLVGSSDPRWHECGHGTAFKSDWLNNSVYHFACFNVLREPTIWRWSHTRHHTDTIIIGRDPEIITPRPPKFFKLLLVAFNLHQFNPKGGMHSFRNVFVHALGRKTFPESDFVPESEWPKVFIEARAWVALWALVAALAIVTGSILPLLYIGLPWFVGHWLLLFFGVTQHLGLADDVLDHRLNTRTIYMNPVFRFLYLNMNYHVEHHMFPMVPYHALPALHEEVKAYTPLPYPSTWAAYKEFVPTLIRQLRNPEIWAAREIPRDPESASAT
jgi:fatty acid desaturase